MDAAFDPADPNAVTLDAFTQFWRTDLNATLRLNRACRDWSKAFFRALVSYGLDGVASFSTELAHVDPTSSAGNGAAVLRWQPSRSEYSGGANQLFARQPLLLAGSLP